MAATITKGDLVSQMFSVLRISGITRAASPEDMMDALTVLERVCLSLENRGLFLGFNKAANLFEPCPDDESGLADKNVHAIVLMLAKNVAPLFGKQLPFEVLSELDMAEAALFPSIPPIRVQNPYQPAGQGNRRYCYSDRWYSRYMPDDDRLTVENNGQLENLFVLDEEQSGFHD